VQKQKLWLRESKNPQILRRLAILSVGKRTIKSGFSARGAKIGDTNMKAGGDYYFCDI
jgi:hypothetical protein